MTDYALQDEADELADSPTRPMRPTTYFVLRALHRLERSGDDRIWWPTRSIAQVAGGTPGHTRQSLNALWRRGFVYRSRNPHRPGWASTGKEMKWRAP